MDIKEINFNSKIYPEKLREIENPPLKLYGVGNLELLNKESLSIVGSRNCTEYGEKMAKYFAREIAKRDIVIISGMAKGIDSWSHLGAIEGGGKTVAVLGSGFNHIFPNKKIFNEILKKGGAIITEYTPEIEVFSQGFRDRNRIVAGLSLGTLVIEAKERSGTGITAEFAKRFGKRIFSIPHNIGDKAGVGTNRLLKKGAILVTEPNDILKYYNVATEIIEENKLEIEIPEEYRLVYNELGEQKNSDEISKKTNLPINQVNTILTMLELEGFIESLPGNYYIKKEY